MARMRVVIEARLPDPRGSGGVSQAVISLATALSTLNDCRPGEEFVFVTLESAGDWLDSHIGGACRLHKIPLTWKNRISRSPFGPLAKTALRGLRKFSPAQPPTLLHSDGTAEELGATLIHFPTQEGYRSALPTIYQPHDLQHLHLPQYFPSAELAWRTLAYPAYCADAKIVLVESSWTKEDIIAQYGVAPGKIVVCPFPPPTIDYREPTSAEMDGLERRLLHKRFVFYPANTWPHKNHVRLIESLALLKQRNVMVPLVCTGRSTPSFPDIEATVSRLGLADQVQFLGYTTESEIRALYKLCTAVVVPTLFESISFPVWEAFQAGKPVACSTVTSLPDQVGDAGLLFDPHDPEAIAGAIARLWKDPELCETLGLAGTNRLRQFSLNRMALHVRALYRQIAGSADERDRELLSAPPLI